jgi:DNA-binding NarL/FixJ family response regulator
MQRQKSFATILVGKSVLIREGIARILHGSHFRTVASASCVEDLPSSHFQQRHLLFLIVHTGDDFDLLLEQIEFLRDKHPTGCIAIVADHCQLDELVSAFRAGAKGYFVDPMNCDVFIKSIELVMMGETIFPPAFLSFTLDPNHVDKTTLCDDDDVHPILISSENTIVPQLSPRERLILHYLIEGDPNKCIARKIDIAEATVKVHVKAILRKIRVQNRTQAAIWGMNNGSLARPVNGDAVPSTVDGEPFRTQLQAISEIRKTGVRHRPLGDVSVTRHGARVAKLDARDPSDPAEVIIPQGNQLEVPPIDRSIRKGVNRNGAGRVAK